MLREVEQVSKQGADPSIYNYTPNDDLLVQFSGSRLRELTNQIGEELEPSIWLGETKSVKCVSTTVTGIGVTYANSKMVLDSVESDYRTNKVFGLCRAYTAPSVSTTVYPVNWYTVSIYPDNSLIWDFGSSRVSANACRWTDKESVFSAPYAFYPMTKLFKGGAVAYFELVAYKAIPTTFNTYNDFIAWLNNSANRWEGTPESYEAVKETYPNVYDIALYFKCGAQGGQNRSVTACLFYPQNTKCVAQQLAMWDGSEFTQAYDSRDRYAGKNMSYGVIPQGARVINYYSMPYLFRGCYTAKYSSASSFSDIPYGAAWLYSMGLEGYRYWIDISTSDCNAKISFTSFPINELVDLITGLGFAATDSGSSTAANGNIDTNVHIWTPTYDNNGNIDGKTNVQEEKEEYTTDGENGGFIQPNFDPYADEEEEEEVYPDENPSEEQETDEVLLPDVTLNSYGVFNRSYVLNKTKVQDLSNYLWNTDSDLFDTIMNDLKLVGDNRMNSIINIMMFPFEIPRGEEMHIIRIGRHNTDVVAKYLDATNLVFDMGSCYCYAKFKNFLDYEPYTQSWLYVPFCGVFKVPSQQFMNKYIHVKLAVDILTGAGQAVIYAGGVPIFYKNCKIGMQIPVTGADSSYTIKNYIAGTQSALSAIAAAPNNTIGALQSSINAAVSFISAQNAPVESVGSSSPQCGILMPNKAYFICERPKTLIKNVPDYGRLVGYACYKSGLIGEFTGYSKFENVKLDFTNANDYEKAEIRRLLKEGVYL
jgi:hypothetical protein